MASFDRRHAEVVSAEFVRQPLGPSAPLTDADLARLPAPVQRYVRASGAVGRPRPQNVRVEFDALMRRNPGSSPMVSTSVQYNFFGRPARLFLMKARMFGLPVRALHLYRAEEATFQVRILDMFNVVDQAGVQISGAETVTLLNDMTFMAPGTLVDERLAWQPVDDRSARVTLTNGPHRVTATLVFNERDEMVDFWSDDRPDSSSGTFVPMRWNTPIGEYRDVAGMRLPTWGGAVWARREGPFMYGEFRLRSLRFDVPGPTPTEPAPVATT
jgi:hypothetical protein